MEVKLSSVVNNYFFLLIKKPMLDGGNQVKAKSKIRLSGVKFDRETDFRQLFVK